ncbi:hypothetical protein [Streptomyces sioyaensis]|uniref:hypothetical protein n=1 Tax=Streptomyces sioyaensis TaxID=67364 RepID=UPI0037AAD496
MPGIPEQVVDRQLVQQHCWAPVPVRAAVLVRPASAVTAASPISTCTVCRSPLFAAVYAAVASSELFADSRAASGMLRSARTSCAALTAMSVARLRWPWRRQALETIRCASAIVRASPPIRAEFSARSAVIATSPSSPRLMHSRVAML